MFEINFSVQNHDVETSNRNHHHIFPTRAAGGRSVLRHYLLIARISIRISWQIALIHNCKIIHKDDRLHWPLSRWYFLPTMSLTLKKWVSTKVKAVFIAVDMKVLSVLSSGHVLQRRDSSFSNENGIPLLILAYWKMETAKQVNLYLLWTMGPFH